MTKNQLQFWTQTTLCSVEINQRGEALDSDQRVLDAFGSYHAAATELKSMGWTPAPRQPGESHATTVFINNHWQQNVAAELAAGRARDKAEREAMDWNNYTHIAVQPGGFTRELDSGQHRGIARFDSQADSKLFFTARGWHGPYTQRCPNDDWHFRRPGIRSKI